MFPGYVFSLVSWYHEALNYFPLLRVTNLAILQQYKVDPKLYSVIYGESILNDAT
jgi:hypothetical protein